MKNSIPAYLFLFIYLIILIGCGKQEESKALTKDEIQEIESSYLNSENILNIENTSTISDRGTIITGTMQSGTYSTNNIVEYIDIYGNLKKATITSIEEFQSTDMILSADDNGVVLLQGVTSEEIKFSSILFKQAEYNGISITFIDSKDNIKKLENYLQNNEEFEIEINTEKVSVQLVSFYTEYVNDAYNYINASVIVDNDKTYEVNTSVILNKFTSTGTINDILK